MEHNKSYKPHNLDYYIRVNNQKMHFNVHELFYSQFSHQNVSAAIAPIFRVLYYYKNTKVHILLVVSSSQLTTFAPLYSYNNVTLKMAAIAEGTFW
jgi:hypothetical protein